MTTKDEALRAARDALKDALALIAEENGWGTYRRMESSELYDDAESLRGDATRALTAIEAALSAQGEEWRDIATSRGRSSRSSTSPGMTPDMTTKDEALRAAWQPIATAPKDGTRILVFRPAEYDGERRYPEHVGIDRFMEHVWYESRRAQQPTHWMSLPTPPGCASPAPADDLAALRAENEVARQRLGDMAKYRAANYAAYAKATLYLMDEAAARAALKETDHDR